MMIETDVEKKKMGTGAKVAIGCGSGCLVVFLLGVIVLVGGYFYVKKTISKYEAELKSYGFESVTSAQVIDITEPVSDPVLLKGQVVRIMADCSTNIAVLAQVCEVHSRVDGKLYFRGQILTVQPHGEILGGVDVRAQVIENRGQIKGSVSGTYQVLNQAAGASNEPTVE